MVAVSKTCLGTLPSFKALLDGATTTEQIASVIVGNAVRRDGGVPMADSRAIAEVFRKRHADVLRSIDRVLAALPDQQRNFAFMQEMVPTHNGGHRERRYFTMNREGFNVLVLGFTGTKALRYRAGFVLAFERLAERERDNVHDFHKHLARNPSTHPLVITKNKALRAEAQARRRRRYRSDLSPGFDLSPRSGPR